MTMTPISEAWFVYKRKSKIWNFQVNLNLVSKLLNKQNKVKRVHKNKFKKFKYK